MTKTFEEWSTAPSQLQKNNIVVELLFEIRDLLVEMRPKKPQPSKKTPAGVQTLNKALKKNGKSRNLPDRHKRVLL